MFTKDSINVEVISGKENGKQPTGGIAAQDIPIVYNYSVGSYQKATLKRRR